MTRERMTIMQIRHYVETALIRQDEIEAKSDKEGLAQSKKFAAQLRSAQAYLSMLNDILTVYFENDAKEEAAYEQSLRKEGIIE